MEKQARGYLRIEIPILTYILNRNVCFVNSLSNKLKISIYFRYLRDGRYLSMGQKK